MLDATRHDDELALLDQFRVIAELHPETAAHDQKQLILGLVVVPHEGPGELDQLDLLSVQLANHLRAPVLLELRKLLGEIYLFHQFFTTSAPPEVDTSTLAPGPTWSVAPPDSAPRTLPVTRSLATPPPLPSTVSACTVSPLARTTVPPKNSSWSCCARPASRSTAPPAPRAVTVPASMLSAAISLPPEACSCSLRGLTAADSRMCAPPEARSSSDSPDCVPAWTSLPPLAPMPSRRGARMLTTTPTCVCTDSPRSNPICSVEPLTSVRTWGRMLSSPRRVSPLLGPLSTRT